MRDLSPLAGLKNLEGFQLHQTKASRPLSAGRPKETPEIDLEDTEVHDLSPLAGMENLEELYLDRTEVSDLSPLAGLKNLRSLTLWEYASE